MKNLNQVTTTKTISKKLIITMVIATLIVSSVSVYAATKYQELVAQVRSDVTVTLNGLPQTLTDGSGKTVYPVMINGSTYLPVRAVANLVNLPVEWDSKTQKVKLGTEQTGPKYLFNQQLKGTEYQKKISDASLLTVNTAEGQQTFKNGISHTIWNNSMSSSDYKRMANFDVTGATKITLTGYSPERNVKITISGEKASDVVASFEVKKGQIVTKTFELDGRQEISFGIDGTEEYYEEGYNVKTDAYIFDAYIE